jgi:hypothetical protein
MVAHLLSVSQCRNLEVLDRFFDVVDGFVGKLWTHDVGVGKFLGIIKDEGSTRRTLSSSAESSSLCFLKALN